MLKSGNPFDNALAIKTESVIKKQRLIFYYNILYNLLLGREIIRF